MARIVVLGSANADLVVSVNRRPVAGETVLGRDFIVLPGGKGANQAAAAGRLGGQVWFVGCVGSDSYAETACAALSEAGVNTTRVRRTGGSTGLAFITVAEDGDNSIVVVPGANAQVTAADVDALADLLGPGSLLVLELELELEVVERAAALAASRGARVLLNLAPATRVSTQLLANTDVLVVNESEAAFLAGDGDQVITRLRELGPDRVVVTLGPEGALVNDAGTVAAVPAPEVAVVDTTGAGDAFVGALAVGLASGAAFIPSVEFAVRAASSTVGTRGAQASYKVLSALQA